METVSKSEKMWDKRAKSYPRYTPLEDTFEAMVIDMIEKRGVPLSGSTLLDIGCGSGKFSIGLAKKVGSLHGIDISGEMIKILLEDAAAEGVENITAQKTDWAGFEKNSRYDIVFCSTTPAVRSPEDYLIVHSMAQRAVAYLGWAGRKESDISIAACNYFDVSQPIFNDTPDLKEWLDGTGIKYQADVIENEFSRENTLEEAEETVRGAVRQQGIVPTKKEIGIILRRFAHDGKVRDRHYFRRELITWVK